MNDRLPFGERIGTVNASVPGRNSKELARRLTAVEAPNVTYIADDFPIFWKEALGSNVEDVDGNIYVDLTAAFGVANLGHGNPVVSTAVAKQLGALGHGMGDVHPPEIKVELLEKLSSLFPLYGGQTILCNGGSEAVEVALKTATLCTGRPGIIAFEGAYHGLSYGALAVGGQLKFREPFHAQLPRFSVRARFPQAKGDQSRDEIDRSISELTSLIDEASTPIGALLLEPIQGRAGVVVPPRGWLRALRTLTRERKILMIVDEIMTGFGRTGARFAVDHEEVVPDLLCVGKAMSGLMPISACIGKTEVMRAWPSLQGEALHTSTFLGHPLGCAAALASIQELERRDLAARVNRFGKEILSEIRSWQQSLPRIEDVRGRGFMIGISLASETAGFGFQVARAALQKGIIVLPAGIDGNVISLTPPLTIGGRQLEWSLGVLKETIRQFS